MPCCLFCVQRSCRSRSALLRMSLRPARDALADTLTSAVCRVCAPPACLSQELGTGILQNLASQRETIVRSRDTLHGADSNITKARKLLSGMSRRLMQNKLIMFGVMGLLLAAIILIIYFKTRK
jgi:hypothetical protein